MQLELIMNNEEELFYWQWKKEKLKQDGKCEAETDNQLTTTYTKQKQPFAAEMND